MTGRAPVLLGLLIAGVLGLVASAQPWWRAVGDGVSARFTGSDATAGLSQALAVVLLAGTLLLLVLKARGRQILGALLALDAAGMAAAGLARTKPSAEAIRAGVREVSLADQFALVGTGWPIAYAVAGLLGAVAAVLVVLKARAWATTSRFDRGTAPSAAAPEVSEPADIWRAFDAGVDPTEARGSDPDVQPERSRDTIEEVVREVRTNRDQPGGGEPPGPSPSEK